MYEAQIRDLIVENIELLEKGLSLIKKEQYIPNELGTKGFIDLYAKDIQGNHVLIELKRSDASAREAIHEVYKYVEGVKRHLGAKDSEIRVIVASTEWKELLIPFSRFASDTSLSVKGMKINVTDTSLIEAYPVEILPQIKGRFIAPWHEICWYSNEHSLSEGIESIEKSCEVKGIKDYVIVVIKFPQPIIAQKQGDMQSAIIQMFDYNNICMQQNAKLPEYKYMAYFGMQILSKERYLSILSKDAEQYEQIQEMISDMDDEEEILAYLHEEVTSLEPLFKSDFYEIGYAAKLVKYIRECKYPVQEIKRYGLFKRNNLLNDENIISELAGEDGNTKQTFERAVEISNRVQMNSARTEIKTCLEENPIWRNHIIKWMDEIEKEYPTAQLYIKIFNPATGVFTPYLTIMRENGEKYIPSYILEVKNPDIVRVYYGGLENNGHALTFYDILDKYYNGNIAGLLFTLTWGGKDSRDIDIEEDMGCIYRSFRCDIKDDGNLFFKWIDDRWRECVGYNYIELYYDYLEKNQILIKQILCKISPRDNLGIMDGSDNTKLLDKIADINKGKILNKYYIDPPEECDLCKCELKRGKYMVDGQIKGSSVWANMCHDCAVYRGSGIGWGKGQLYLNYMDKWLLVGGFEDEDE